MNTPAKLKTVFSFMEHCFYTSSIATLENNQNDTMYYIHKDHLGSFDVVTGESGNVVERMSFDPWGRRRNPTNWTYSGVSSSYTFERGFTGHEHINEFGLVNMNGRVYDAVLGRFTSPDKIVQAPSFTQSYNRYSYTFNNPLKYTDPSGFGIPMFGKGIFKKKNHQDGSGIATNGNEEGDCHYNNPTFHPISKYSFMLNGRKYSNRNLPGERNNYNSFERAILKQYGDLIDKGVPYDAIEGLRENGAIIVNQGFIDAGKNLIGEWSELDKKLNDTDDSYVNLVAGVKRVRVYEYYIEGFEDYFTTEPPFKLPRYSNQTRQFWIGASAGLATVAYCASGCPYVNVATALAAAGSSLVVLYDDLAKSYNAGELNLIDDEFPVSLFMTAVSTTHPAMSLFITWFYTVPKEIKD